MTVSEDTKALSLEEQAQRLINVSIKTPEHLKAWLEQTNRKWLVFNSLELVDALPFPEGLDTFIQVIACYRDHRMVIPSGRVEIQKDPVKGEDVEVSIMKTDVLEVDELDRAIRYLIGQITTLEPSWKLENPPM